jgi:hypothetical protein
VQELTAKNLPIEKPYLTSKGSGMTIVDLPFDIIREICDQVTQIHPPLPLQQNRATIRNPFTSKEETRLELNSHAFTHIIDYLNGGPARRDLESLASTCNGLHGSVKKSMNSIRETDMARTPFCIDQFGSKI